MSSHCCEHECKHEQVKFCQGCKAVYCASCKQKWEEPCRMTHGYPWTYTTTAGIEFGSTTGSVVYNNTVVDCAVHQ